MNEKDLRVNVIGFPGTAVVTGPTTAYPTTRAKSVEIAASNPGDFPQYGNVIRAINATNGAMSFEDVAKAAESLGDKVIRSETDAPLRAGWQEEGTGVIEDEHKILAWQTRGEKVSSIIPRLSAPQSVTGGQEIVIISRGLAIAEPMQGQTIDVIEGVEVSLKQQDAPAALPNPATLLTSTTHDQQLEKSPFLQPIQEPQKAA